MKFKDFIQMDEVGTSTSCIASFKRIAIPNVRRIFPPELNWTDPEEKKGKKNPYRVPQLDENMGALMQGIGQGLGIGQGSGNGDIPSMMKSSAETTKVSAQHAEQMAAIYDVKPETKQLGTLLKSISSSYNRISDQWVQASNMAATAEQQQATNQVRQPNIQPNGNKITGAINSIGNAVTGIIGQGGKLSAGTSVQ